MSVYGSLSDDYYVNVQLNTEMELPSERETVLFFFEQLRRKYPTMKNFYQRDKNEYVLEEDKEQGNYRWATVEPRRVYSAYVNPPSLQEAFEQNQFVMDMVPHSLSVTPLDCESLSCIFGFDFTYRGNHNSLIAEALGHHPVFEKLTDIPGTQLMSYEPSIIFALDESCSTRCRISVESRTSPHQIRTGEYTEDQISVFVVVRYCDSLDAKHSYASVLENLQKQGQNVVEGYVIDNILVPLQQHIAIK